MQTITFKVSLKVDQTELLTEEKNVDLSKLQNFLNQCKYCTTVSMTRGPKKMKTKN